MQHIDNILVSVLSEFGTVYRQAWLVWVIIVVQKFFG